MFNIKRTYYKKKLYFRLLISFTMLAILIVLTISIVFSGMYINNVYNKLQDNYSNTFEKYTKDFDDIFIRFRQAYVSFCDVPEIKTYFYSAEPDYNSIIRIDNYLPTMVNAIPYLHSLFLYNSSYSYQVNYGKLGYDINSLPDEKLTHPDTKSTFNMIISSLYANHYQKINPRRALSVVFSVLDNPMDSIDKSFIMNIDSEEIENKLFGNLEGITIVADKSGKIIFDTDKSHSINSIANEQYFHKVIASNNSRGSFRMAMNEEDTVLTYSISQKTGLYIINIRSFNNLSKVINSKIIILALISLLVILVYGFTGFVLSRKIYSPINRILGMLSDYKLNSSDPQIDETALISKVFSETFEKLQEFKNISDDVNVVLKQEFLQSVLKGKDVSDMLDKKVKLSSLNIEFSNLFLASVSIDNYNNIEENKKYACENTLRDIIPELLKCEFNCEAVNMNEGVIAVLMNFKDSKENSFNQLLAAMDNIREKVNKTLQISITVGIGDLSDSIQECSSAYKKSVEMVKHRFVIGLNKTIYQKHLEDNLSSSIDYPYELENRLITTIRSNDRESFTASLRSIMSMLKDQPYASAVSVLFQIMTACIKTINETADKEKRQFYLRFDEFNRLFSELQTVDDASDWLLGLFKEYQHMQDELKQLKNNKHYHAIKLVQDYIKENYSDQNLSTEALAERTGYTTYYFSKIFKDIAGINVTDYIRQLRINRAKELLANTNLKTNEVSDISGFSNSSNFYLVFKKDVGFTPAAYREYVLHGKIISENE